MITDLEALYQPIATELASARALVSELWHDTHALAQGGSQPKTGAGGKLLRPALCLLAAGAAGAPDLSRFVPLSAAAEALHLAALSHDDVVDKAMLRRGNLSLNALYDDRTAILGGDYLVARAILMLSEYGSVDLLVSVFRAVLQMTEGELGSLASMAANEVSEADCLRLAEQKTATLFAAACVAPTYLVGADRREPLARYGKTLGIAFQLIDDVLDLTQTEEKLGKPACGDIAEGKKTIPLLYLWQSLNGNERGRLDGATGRPVAVEDRRWVAAALERSGARARTEALARRYVDEAKAALDPVPSSRFKSSMLELAEFVLVRAS